MDLSGSIVIMRTQHLQAANEASMSPPLDHGDVFCVTFVIIYTFCVDLSGSIVIMRMQHLQAANEASMFPPLDHGDVRVLCDVCYLFIAFVGI